MRQTPSVKGLSLSHEMFIEQNQLLVVQNQIEQLQLERERLKQLQFKTNGTDEAARKRLVENERALQQLHALLMRGAGAPMYMNFSGGAPIPSGTLPGSVPISAASLYASESTNPIKLEDHCAMATQDGLGS